MYLWKGSLNKFFNDTQVGAIAGAMVGHWTTVHGAPPGQAEINSWSASLKTLAETLEPLKQKEIGVLLEYHLPYSFKRLDVMLFGRDKMDQANALVIELKQWSEVLVDDIHTMNVNVGDIEHPHPSQQAFDYANTLESIHSAFTDDKLKAFACSYCHNLNANDATLLRNNQFTDLISKVPLFAKDDSLDLMKHVAHLVSQGGGSKLLDDFVAGRFKPGKKLIESLSDTIDGNTEWHLLDEQRVAYESILAEVKRAQKNKGNSAILINGGPGTGKTVIAVQLLSASLRLGFSAAHSTGGRAFTTVLKSKLNKAQDLFIGNINLRNAPTQGLDLLLVDEAHRIRETSDTRFTPAAQRNQKPQTKELLDAAKVTTFFLDENQYMRPDEIGCAQLIRDAAKTYNMPLKEYSLETQFRCGGSTEYVDWIDYVLHFNDEPPAPLGKGYKFSLAESPEELETMVQHAIQSGENARIVAGFCWEWSDPREDDSLIEDVVINNWKRPWNRKANSKKQYRPEKHPYTLWAETEEGIDQVGCIYSAQGFEFDRVGVIWGPDLVWREGEWIAQRQHSYDNPVKRKNSDTERLLRNAYRVLLTRGLLETKILCLDEETREHLQDCLDEINEI